MFHHPGRCILLALAILVLSTSARDSTAQDHPLAYQGQLVDDAGVPIDIADLGAGARIELRLGDSPSPSGSEVSCGWTSDVDSAGQFSVVLNAACVASLDAAGTSPRYYSVVAGPVGAEVRLVNRAQVGAVPFARQARTASTSSVARAGDVGFRVPGGLDLGLVWVYRNSVGVTTYTSERTVACPAGKYLLSGACEVYGGGGGAQVRSGYPLSATVFACRFDVPSERNVRVWALCGDVVAPTIPTVTDH